jgi:hydrogenase/urease accessory protein HupE
VKALATLLILVAWLASGAVTEAHEIRPALVQITQRDAHHYDILWKQPVNGELAVHLVPRLSGGALDGEPSLATVTPAFALKLWRNVSDESRPLDGQTLSIEGLERTITDVLVNVTLSDGRSVQQFLKPHNTSVHLELSPGAPAPAAAYLSLGIEHILTGIDHLLFVFGLLLLVGRNWALLKTITAFTIAHSITLAATTLGWLHIRSSVVEALVALSIVVLAVELAQRHRGEGPPPEVGQLNAAASDGAHVGPDRRGALAGHVVKLGYEVDQRRHHVGVTSRYPWVIAFVFGLLHGCAFAGALSEVGLPQEHIPLALFLFNVGVETGQLLFIAAASAVLWFVKNWINSRPAWAHRAIPYAMGVFSSYWFIERFLIAIGHSA